MTTGQLLFYSGIALLVVTVIVAIVFFIKKPVYRPENAVAAVDGKTVPLRSGYPTNPITVRHEPEAAAKKETTPISPLTQEESQGTVPLPVDIGTVSLEAGTVLLPDDCQPYIDETVPLTVEGGTDALDSCTTLLDPGTAELDQGTVPLAPTK